MALRRRGTAEARPSGDLPVDAVFSIDLQNGRLTPIAGSTGFGLHNAANAAKDAYDFLGSPEGELAIAEAVVYVATAPKSNALYTAFAAARKARALP